MPVERVYSVLLVSAAPNLNAVFRGLLAPSVFSPVQTVSDLGAAKRAFQERAYDIVIVNSPLPDGPGVRFAADVCAGPGAVALVLAPVDTCGELSARASAHGVFTLAKPFSRAAAQTAVEWLVCARERLRNTETKNLSLEEKMEEIRLVNRAKWLLIEREGIDEPTAHRYIEKLAMDRCVPRRAIAEELLQTN